MSDKRNCGICSFALIPQFDLRIYAIQEMANAL
jgi:hypothetical protein